MDKTAFIVNLYDSPFFWERSSLINALVAALSPDEACILLDTSFRQSFDLRRSILRKIASDMARGFLAVHRSIVRELLEGFESLPYRKKNACSHALGVMFPSLPHDLRSEVLRFLLESRYVIARRKAYALMQDDWDPEYGSLLEEVWNRHKDLKAAHLIVDQLSYRQVVYRMDALHSVLLEAGFAHLSRLYIRLGAPDPEIVERLADIDGITYAYVCAKIDRRIPDSQALAIFEASKFDERIGLLIWSYGQLGLWTVLENIARRVDDIEDTWVTNARER